MADGLFKLQCTTCGGTLVQVEEGKYRCENCRLTYERQAGSATDGEWNEASALRWNGRFQEALTVYDRLLERKPNDFEANWGAFLCDVNVGYITAADGSQTAVFYGVKPESLYDNYYYCRAMANCPSHLKGEFVTVADYLESTRKKAEKEEKSAKYDAMICCVRYDIGGETADYKEAKRLYDLLKKRGAKVFFPQLDLQGVHPSFIEPRLYAAIKKSDTLIAVAFDEANATADEMKGVWRRYPRINPDGKVVLVYADRPDVFPGEIFRAAAKRFAAGSQETVDYVFPQKAETAAAKPDAQPAAKPATTQKEKPASQNAGGSAPAGGGDRGSARVSSSGGSSREQVPNSAQYVKSGFAEYGVIRTNPRALREIADCVRKYNTVQAAIVADCVANLGYLVGQWDDANMDAVLQEMQRARNNFESKMPEAEVFCRWLEEKADLLDRQI